MKRFFICMLCLLAVLVPQTALAADGDGDGYDDAELAAVRAIIAQSETLTKELEGKSPNEWTEYFNWDASGHIGLITLSYGKVTDLQGELDLRPFTHLFNATLDSSEGVTAVYLPPSLKHLIIADLGVEHLDLSGLTDVRYLSILRTQISKLDLSACQGLESVTVSQCEKLNELDLSCIPKVTEFYVNGPLHTFTAPNGIVLKTEGLGNSGYVSVCTEEAGMMVQANVDKVPEGYRFGGWKNVPYTNTHTERFALKEDTTLVAEILSNDNSITSLQVGETALDVDVYLHELQVEHSVEEIEIAVQPNHSGATVKGAGLVPLQVGENILSVTVASEYGDQRIYTVCITREAAPLLPFLLAGGGLVLAAALAAVLIIRRNKQKA